MKGALLRKIADEQLALLPERALYWPARRLLVVADTHFGKGSIFARHGIAVPGGPDSLDQQRISQLLQHTGAARLLILGDFLHGELQHDSPAARQLEGWLAALHPVTVELVTGNHDRTAARGWQAPMSWQGDQLAEGPFCFTHDASQVRGTGGRFRIGGHVHPVVAIGGLRKRRVRVPVFWERTDSLVLPSFGLFTGGYRIKRSDGGSVFAAGPEDVLEVWREGRAQAAEAD